MNALGERQEGRNGHVPEHSKEIQAQSNDVLELYVAMSMCDPHRLKSGAQSRRKLQLFLSHRSRIITLER